MLKSALTSLSRRLSSSSVAKSKQTYTLMVGDKGTPRLRALNKMCNPHSLSFISNNINLQNKSVLDLGCGIGILSSEIAKRTLPSGKVVAADISKEQLVVAQFVARESDVKNIEFREISALEIDKLNIKFDLIYCRFLLVHLADVSKIIAKIVKIMHKESVLICEEPNGVESLYCQPNDPSYDKFKLAALTHANSSHGSFSIGKNLHSLFKEHKLAVIQETCIRPELDSKELKDQLWQGIIEITPLLLASGFATEHEIENLINSLKEFSSNSKAKATYWEYTQIAAKLSL